MKKSLLCLFGFLMLSAAYSSTNNLPLSSNSLVQYQCNPHNIYSFFNPRVRPSPVSPDLEGRLVCHDVNLYGTRDHDSFPRLNEKQATFKLWDKNNLMFYDINGDGNMDVSNFISEEARTYG